MYLLESYKGTEKIMGVILSAAYIVAKGSDLLQRVKFLKRSFIKFLQKTVSLTFVSHDLYPQQLNHCSHSEQRQARSRFKLQGEHVPSVMTTTKMQLF